jgi:hypothetical protein
MKKILSILTLVMLSVLTFATNIPTENLKKDKKSESFYENVLSIQKFDVALYQQTELLTYKNLKKMNNFNTTTELMANLNEIRNGVSFVNILYTNQADEVQKTTFNVGVSYNKAKEKDFAFLETLDVKTLKSDMPTELLEQARVALLEALLKPNKAKSEAQKNAYEHLINGVKMHKETKDLYVFGMKVKKTIVSVGEYKEDTRKPLTKAKDLIRTKMKSTKYRQYKIESTAKVKVRGNELIFEL